MLDAPSKHRGAAVALDIAPDRPGGHAARLVVKTVEGENVGLGRRGRSSKRVRGIILVQTRSLLEAHGSPFSCTRTGRCLRQGSGRMESDGTAAPSIPSHLRRPRQMHGRRGPRSARHMARGSSPWMRWHGETSFGTSQSLRQPRTNQPQNPAPTNAMARERWKAWWKPQQRRKGASRPSVRCCLPTTRQSSRPRPDRRSWCPASAWLAAVHRACSCGHDPSCVCSWRPSSRGMQWLRRPGRCIRQRSHCGGRP
mmetsp:Transcript_6182/g.10627  ORF Transcript_6182/g.10627 Transcript_6182/m.10627 type:complete len:254 (-) Transcript_6182:1199-1960(-)